MKLHYATMALIAGVSVMYSSCVAPSAGYATFSSPGGTVSTGVAWTDASYDADGFPIFGYSNGRPVYGYTSTGAAIFTIAALTALCFVPHWSPASWYSGHYHYPKGIHRVSAPPRYPKGHSPARRPSSGIKPPPAPHRPATPGHNNAWRPSTPGHNNAWRPSAPGHNQPNRGGFPSVSGSSHGMPRTLPATPGHKVAPTPSFPQHRAPKANPLPSAPGRVVSPVPSVKSPNTPRTLPAPSGGRAIMPVPSVGSSGGGVRTLPAPSGGRAIMPAPSSSSAPARHSSAPSSPSRHNGGGGHLGGGRRR